MLNDGLRISRTHLLPVGGSVGLVPATLVAATLGLVVVAAYSGRLRDALATIVLLLLIPLFIRRPLLLVLAYLLISGNLFETIPLRSIELVRLGPGLTFKSADVLVALMLVVALVRLRERGQRPMFLGFVVLWSAYVVFRFLLGSIVGETGLDLATNMAQEQLGWVMYLLLVGLIDSRRDLRFFGWFFISMMAVASLYQVAEYAHGSRILLFPVAVTDSNYYTITPMLTVGNVAVPYLWSRAMSATVVGFFLVFAAALEGKRFLLYGILASAGLLSVVMTQIRAAYFGVAVGVLAVLIVRRWSARSSLRLLMLVAILALMVALLTPALASSFGQDPVGTWLTRASGLMDPGAQANWTYRVDQAKSILGVMRESPLLGFGWGATYLRERGESGLNVLLVHGFLGTAIILVMFLTVLLTAVRLARRLKPSLEQAWLFGLVGVMVANLAMSPTQDSLMSGGFAVVAAVFVDRISAFNADGSLDNAGTATSSDGDA